MASATATARAEPRPPRRFWPGGRLWRLIVVLNLLGLDTHLIPYVIDDTPGYMGKYVPGVGTEVVARDDPRAGEAGMVLITAPTHIREIVERDRETRGRDRLYVATVPRFHIVDV